MNKRIQKWTLLITCVLSLCFLAGCASPNYPDYPIETLNEYVSHSEQHNLSVAAKALTDPQEVRKYFGSNLLEDGILPVHIVVANHSLKDSYILLKENVELLESGKITSENRQQVGHDAESLRNVGQILLSVALTAYGDTQAIGQKENFALKEFQQESIEPGQKANGFIYFRRPNTTVDMLTLRTVLHQPLTRQQVTIDLKL